MVAKSGALDSLLEFPDSLKLKYKEQADRCSLQFIYDALAVTSQCEAGYKESINPRLHIEFALMKLCFLTGGPVSLKQPAPQPVQDPLQDAPVSISCRAGRSSAAAYRVCPSVHSSRASVMFPRKSSGVTKV